jgi:hypothetical protein
MKTLEVIFDSTGADEELCPDPPRPRIRQQPIELRTLGRAADEHRSTAPEQGRNQPPEE